MTFNPNVPTGLVPLDEDYANVQANFNQANTTMAVNHYRFSDTSSNNGKHFYLQIPAPQTPPATGAMEFSVFNAVSTYDTATTNYDLRYQNPNNGATSSLLRGAIGTSNPLVQSGNGYSQLPGGLILQFGQFTINGTMGTGFKNGGPVTFPISFPNNVYQIVFTAKLGAGFSSSSDRLELAVGSYIQSGGAYTGFNWGTVFSLNVNIVLVNWIAIGA